MAPSSAALVQLSRTMDATWRDTDHRIVRGGPTAHSASTDDKRVGSPKMPAWELPLAMLLSVPPAKPHGTSSQRPSTETSHLRPSSPELSPKSAFAQGFQTRIPNDSIPLRERVKRTRQLPESLRAECLERLERIDKEIPLKLRHRPSWTHDDADPLLSSQKPVARHSVGANRESEEDINGNGGALVSPTSPDRIPRSQPEISDRMCEHIVIPFDQLELPDTHGGRRRRHPWMVDACDLTAAASVWKSSAKCCAAPISGKASKRVRYARSTPALGILETSTLPQWGIDRPQTAEDGSPHRFCSLEMSPRPATRGSNSNLRTSLRCVLQC